MPNHTPKRAFGSTEKSRRKSANLDLPTARKMIPLVRGIVRDIVSLRADLNQLQPEQERLDRHRRDLVWDERQRRYQIQDEIVQTRRDLSSAIAELKALGVQIVDRDEGWVDFPTRINGRLAAFSWKADQDDIRYWHYSGEEERRPIPDDWAEGVANSAPQKW